MRLTKVFIFLCLSASIQSCKEEPIERIDFAFEYMPLNVGASSEYEVDSIVYNDFDNTITTYQYFVRETVADTFSDGEGRTVYRVERSKKSSDTSEYNIIASYGFIRDGLRLERLDGNKRVVSLIFPPNRTSEWDGNAYNSEDEQKFYYMNVHAPETISGLSYDSTVWAIQVLDTNNFIEKEYEGEIYAKHIGLVYKESIHIETKLNGDSGLVYRQRRIK